MKERRFFFFNSNMVTFGALICNFHQKSGPLEKSALLNQCHWFYQDYLRGLAYLLSIGAGLGASSMSPQSTKDCI